jgi:integrase
LNKAASRQGRSTGPGVWGKGDLAWAFNISAFLPYLDGPQAGIQAGSAINQNLNICRYAYKKNLPHASLNSFADDLALLPLSERTQQAYLACLVQVSDHYGQAPDLLSPEQLRQYFIHLKTVKKVARQTSTQAICAIKLFWEKTLHRQWPHELVLVRAQPQFKLPVVLSASEVRRILAQVPALDHRVALTLIYSCGLRLSEGLNLEVGHIDSERRLLHIRGGKGNADRYVPLPQRTLQLLRQLWITHRHPTLLFPGKGHNGQGAATAAEPMCRSTLQRAFRLALRASGVQKDAHIHTLRESPATTAIVPSAAKPMPTTGWLANKLACSCPPPISWSPSPSRIACAPGSARTPSSVTICSSPPAPKPSRT